MLGGGVVVSAKFPMRACAEARRVRSLMDFGRGVETGKG